LDALTREQRSENMRRIRSKGMKPELEVRKLVHSLGYRYRLHVSSLPGKPDLVFASRRKIIQVHGCFWHQHKDPACKIVRKPKSNSSYWIEKLKRNEERDSNQSAWFAKEGWNVLTVWECYLADQEKLTRVIATFLNARD
jgi:DNA mismatch endonuclease (patch repair protein)